MSKQKTDIIEAEVKESTSNMTEEAPKAPEPAAMSNEWLTIIKHDIYRKEIDTKEVLAVGLRVKNISDETIGSALFEAELYDIEGNVLDRMENKTFDFGPGITRAINLEYQGPNSNKVRSYRVRVAGIAMPPRPEATGNESIEILKHSLNVRYQQDELGEISSANIIIRNVSGNTIARIVFEAVFYDIEGNLIDTLRHDEIDLEPDASRIVIMKLDRPGVEKVKSYKIKIVKMITADVEKVQLRRHGIKTTDAGKEVAGIIKNISDVKTDAALVASFFDSNDEIIANKVVILRDIESGEIRQFRFVFIPASGETVSRYILKIGDLGE